MSNIRTDNIDQFAEMFKALSNPNRLKIFIRLASCCSLEQTECTTAEMSTCVGELGKDLNIAASTISHHMKELKSADLIKMERCGQMIRCWIEPTTMRKLKEFFGEPFIE